MTDTQKITLINDAISDLDIVSKMIERGMAEEAKAEGTDLWVAVFKAAGVAGSQEVSDAHMNFERKYAVIRQQQLTV